MKAVGGAGTPQEKGPTLREDAMRDPESERSRRSTDCVDVYGWTWCIQSKCSEGFKMKSRSLN
jgi:hypothetical protein